jgi:hypothetical protein
MNKKAIQKFAVWARNELIAQVKLRAMLYGIDEKGYGDENATSVNGRVLSASEKSQRYQFIAHIKNYGFQQAVEEVAYTWFNRFAALRFMEVNNYLPTHVRVFSDSAGKCKPEILKDVLHLELEGLDRAKVAELLNENKADELYSYLLLTQCNALNAALPEMFERLGSYTEMLLPGNILKADGIIGRLVSDIQEEDWKDAVQIIGWLYQYYNTEPKQAVFDGLKKNVKITKEKIPAATQLFTPDWIVRYMVENSLGRIFVGSRIEGLGSSIPETERIAKEKAIADEMGWKYYLPEAEQTSEVRAKLIPNPYSLIPIEDIKVLDCCMGSGHILVYAFDVLMQIYRLMGVADRDATKLILEKNLYGLDIDRRAYQLAYFSLMMKARRYNRRIFTENVRPQVYHPAGWSDGEEYGSLLKIDDPGEKPQESDFPLTYEQDLRVWNFKRLLSQKYDVVVTNPPYMGGSGMGGRLAQYVKDYYPDSKSDLFATFIERGLAIIKPRGFSCMVTMQSWMFLSSFETMRTKILQARTITNLLHMENMVMGIAFGTAVSNLRGVNIDGYKGRYNHITMADIEDDKPVKFPVGGKRDTAVDSANFAKIPGSPVAYWVSAAMLRAFDRGKTIEEIADVKHGMSTGKNEIFVREWWEVQQNDIDFSLTDRRELEKSNRKYFPYNKGGEYRLWYGNAQQIVWYGKNGRAKMFTMSGFRHDGKEWYFRKGITWSFISSSKFGVRLSPSGFVFDVAGSSLFPKIEELNYLLGFLSSSICFDILMTLNPTLNFQVGNIKSIPIIFDNNRKSEIDTLVTSNVSLSRADWDAFEASWDFCKQPLI